MTVQRDIKPKNTKAVARATSCPDLAEGENHVVDEEDQWTDTTPSSVLTRSRYFVDKDQTCNVW